MKNFESTCAYLCDEKGKGSSAAEPAHKTVNQSFRHWKVKCVYHDLIFFLFSKYSILKLRHYPFYYSYSYGLLLNIAFESISYPSKMDKQIFFWKWKLISSTY